MSTRKKRILTVITAAVVLLTLISIYLLGSTYAKYLSAGDTTASAEVADWTVKLNAAVDNTNYNSSVTFGEFSPSVETLNSGYAVKNNTAVKLVAIVQIENTTDVNAKIELSTSNLAYAKTNGTVSYGAGFTVTNKTVTTAPTKNEVDELFSLTFKYYSGDYKSTPADNDFTAYDSSTGITYTANTTTVTYYIYASLTWTTSWVDGTTEHLLDTWVAENIDTVTATATATVTQTSTKPTD